MGRQFLVPMSIHFIVYCIVVGLQIWFKQHWIPEFMDIMQIIKTGFYAVWLYCRWLQKKLNFCTPYSRSSVIFKLHSINVIQNCRLELLLYHISLLYNRHLRPNVVLRRMETLTMQNSKMGLRSESMHMLKVTCLWSHSLL